MPVGYAEHLLETLPRVRERIADAARSVGRDPGEVRLIAVTKGHPLEAVRAALDLGVTDLGENRVEELARKRGELGAGDASGPRSVSWHMIGHVQSRKAGEAAALADVIHSVDSVRLAEKLDRAAAERGRVLSVLVQVNTSGEGTKSGFTTEDTAAAEESILGIAESRHLRVSGLMTMAPLTGDERVLAGTFAALRELRDRLRSRSARIGAELSMGMTNDLAVAVREGSTMVRIGTALFGERR